MELIMSIINDFRGISSNDQHYCDLKLMTGFDSSGRNQLIRCE